MSKSRSLAKIHKRPRHVRVRANPLSMNQKHVILFSVGAAVGALLMHLHMKQ